MSSPSPSVLLCSPIAAGHIAPLLNIAAEAVRRGYVVTIAVSGDPNEPAAKWKDAVSRVGATLLNLDEVFLFETDAKQIGKRILGRAAAAGDQFAQAVISRVTPLPSVILFDFFALWGWIVGHYVTQYAQSHSLPLPTVGCVLSGFPGMKLSENMLKFPEYDELASRLPIPYRHNRHVSIIPEGVPVYAFSTLSVARHTPKEFHLVGPLHIDLSASDVTSPLLPQLAACRRDAVRIVYIALGTMVLRFYGASQAQYLRDLFHSVTVAALKMGLHLDCGIFLLKVPLSLLLSLSLSLSLSRCGGGGVNDCEDC
jgi:hypothetical protein